ncbi:hydrogenase expression/formation protein HypE [Magnetofaba australis]|uniref:Putative hydrogenase expression/formation protein HypE n=1 Tax=Magnetofaba australis IT-1 TaxID=1434232 RepID=A0A1Y2K980_9PROT|nr:hydrogenase expression/formation protein HypE [Magnetofaba australis]OSM07304.1 putative hydrogenase expression/formation protein HypE [Magnetofaba australis IT-1]
MSHTLDIQNGVVEMSHGSGGRASHTLIRELFASHLDNPYLRQNNDNARFDAPPGSLVMSVDSHVVSPIFFPGGDLGALAVHGTLNDVAMSGAVPLHLTAGFILEEGYPLADLERIVMSMARAAKDAGVEIIAGDTKVVERGHGDGVFITTTGIGVIPPGSARISGDAAQPGDAILISGSMGDHGAAIMLARESMDFDHAIQSDSAALHDLIAHMLRIVPNIHCLRDPTRGGLATTLNELAEQSNVGMVIEESAIPIQPQVAAVCELLGLDPLTLANEGKLIAICPPDQAQTLLKAMRAHPLGENAAIIGEVTEADAGMVQLVTGFGGRRILDWLAGTPLPRIC